jgi:nitroreductase
MEFERALYSRRAVREYSDEPVDEATLRRLIDAAVQAPSALNEQPWAFSVVRDPIALGRIAEAAKAHALATAPDLDLPERLQTRLADPNFDIFYSAPALVVISSMTQGPWAVVDCALAAENLMLAARDAGLGSCWIGFAQGWLGTPAGKAAIGAPETWRPVAPIIVGYPESQPAPVPRKEPEVIWIGK